jgi:hypothetical protein
MFGAVATNFEFERHSATIVPSVVGAQHAALSTSSTR